MKKVRSMIVAACLSLGFLSVTTTSVASVDLAELFDKLRERGEKAEEVLNGMRETGVELKDATVFTVVNTGSIGLSVAYAQAGVCLATDQVEAQVIGQAAVDNAPENARNAVQAGVVSALSSYTDGSCQQLLDQINNASQAFAAPTGSAPAGDSAAGGTPPEVDLDEPPASESE